jgi:hypothetical protein
MGQGMQHQGELVVGDVNQPQDRLNAKSNLAGDEA